MKEISITEFVDIMPTEVLLTLAELLEEEESDDDNDDSNDDDDIWELLDIIYCIYC